MALLFDASDDSYDPPMRDVGTVLMPYPTLPPDASPQPTSEWGYGSVFDVLSGVSSGLQAVATTVGQFQQQRDATSLARANAQLAQFKASSAVEIERTRTAGSVDLERLRTQTEIAKAQRGFADASGLTTLQQRLLGTAESPSYAGIMLLLTAVGVVLMLRSKK